MISPRISGGFGDAFNLMESELLHELSRLDVESADEVKLTLFNFSKCVVHKMNPRLG